jgi:hypothetical protein
MKADEENRDRQEKIRERAYAIWESEGCPEGKHLDHWLQAEQQVFAESSTRSGPSNHIQPTAASTRIGSRSA